MPNIKSAKKRVLKTEKNNFSNNNIKSSMKSAIKRVEKAIINKDENISNLLQVAFKKIDKCLKSNIIKTNKAARYKSHLSKMVNNK